MKSKLYFSIILLSLFFFVGEKGNAQAPDWEWAKGMDGTEDQDIGYSIAVDNIGNVYTIGSFRGTVDFDPGTSVFNLTSAGYDDIFLLKLNALGNFVWVKQIGGISKDYGMSLTIDNSGSVYCTGFFVGTVDFNPNIGTFNLSSFGNYDIYILKLDISGNFVWAKQMGGAMPDYGWSITIDGFGNIYTGGFFRGTADFDPDSMWFPLTSSGGEDIFISKLDSSGNFIWAKTIGGVDDERIYSITTDAGGNVYNTGIFYGTVDFNPGSGIFNLTSAGFQDIFIFKLDSSGNFVWAKRMGGQSSDYCGSIACDKIGSETVYTTGSFRGTVDFDPGAGVFNLTSGLGNEDTFVSKLDSSGNFVWAKAISGTYSGFGSAIALDVFGNILTTGTFWGTTDFDPDTGIFNLTPVGSSDIFVSKLNPYGDFVWAQAAGGAGEEVGNDIVLNTIGNIYMTGYFKSPAIIFGSTILTNADSAGNSKDIFISKLSCTTFKTLNIKTCNSYTSPSGNYIWTTSGTYYDTIPSQMGCDSIITINLSIGTVNSSSNQTISACGSYVSPSGNYLWTTSGIYTDTLPNAVACDSIITINLTINNSSTTTQTVATCNDYISPSGNYVWTTSGIYFDTIPNVFGCDSIITINLTINTVDTSVTQNGNVLTANYTGATYQWLDCNNNFAIINGAINQTFTPTSIGSYAVAISQNGCTDTSDCYAVVGVGINENDFENNFEIIPNPANSDFEIVLKNSNKISEITITNLTGKIIYSTTSKSKQKMEVSTKDFSNGIYFVQIQAQDFIETKKLIVAK